MPFPCGYGVECAVLVDAYRTHGLDAIAQVDLGRRAHLHQDLASLGVMAAEVLAAAEKQARTRGRSGVGHPPGEHGGTARIRIDPQTRSGPIAAHPRRTAPLGGRL